MLVLASCDNTWHTSDFLACGSVIAAECTRLDHPLGEVLKSRVQWQCIVSKHKAFGTGEKKQVLITTKPHTTDETGKRGGPTQQVFKLENGTADIRAQL